MFSNKRLATSCIIRICEVGTFVTTIGYVNLGLMGNYSSEILSYFYFGQAVLVMIIVALSQRMMSENPQLYTYLFHGLTALLTFICYGLILLNVPHAIFITSVIMWVASMQIIAVVGNSITSSFDIREYGRYSNRIVAAAGLSAIFFALFSPLIINTFGGIALVPVNGMLYVFCLFLSRHLKPLHEPVHETEKYIQPIQNPFFLILMAFVTYTMTAWVLFDYTFKLILQQNFNEDMIGIITTAFVGTSYFLLIVMQLYGQRKLVEHYGIVNTLLFYPIFIIIFGGLAVIWPNLFFVGLAYGAIVILFDGPLYIANQTLTNAIPKQQRTPARSQLYLFSMVIGQSGIAAISLFFLGEKYGTIPIVMLICIILSIGSLFLIRIIRQGYRFSLKKQIENGRFFATEISNNLTAPNVNEVSELVIGIGHDYSVYDALLFAKNTDINLIPALRSNLETLKDLPNFEGRVAVLGKLESPEIEGVLNELMTSKSLINPNAVAKTVAYRALSYSFTEFFKKSIYEKLQKESHAIIVLSQLVEIETREHMLLELKSNLELAIERFFYYLASLGHTRIVLNTMPKITEKLFIKTEQVSRANAIEYLESIFEDRSIRKILRNTLEEGYNIVSEEEIAEIIAKDPWLSKVNSMEKFTPGENMNRDEKVLFLRHVALFALLPEEILKLIGDSLKYVKKEKGEFVFRMRDSSEEVYFVVSGNVDVLSNKQITTSVSPYGMFGELGVLNNLPRQAEAVATSDAILLSIHRQEFNQLLEDVPEISKAMIYQLASRGLFKMIPGA